ncbi:hypothetical protein [uncultured Methanoregula sp.]|uniref:hypothetical protein n=1 Tax=uncultured Methanoregula sp. TaxID=1005933 RepID=UPI002AAAE910|nr:hypothetical protein [uncultured Methanoregula sp.]
MQAEPFLIVTGTGILVIIISMALDRVWAGVTPVRGIYYCIRAPGIVLHECSHILGCFITGAKIQNIVFFSKEGGSVTYTRPLIPWFGDVIISTAPLFCIPLILSGVTWGFATYLGCTFPTFPDTLSAGTVQMAGAGIISLFTANLVYRQNPWFLLYLYLTVSLVLSVAPSPQDLRNAAIGIFIIAIAGILVFWSNIPWLVTAAMEITRIAGLGFTTGLVFGLIALACSLPLIVWYAYTRIR